MKKFFKPKNTKSSQKDAPASGADDLPIPTPIYQKHAAIVNPPPNSTHQIPPQPQPAKSRSRDDEDRWEVVNNYAQQAHPSPNPPPQSPSPYHASSYTSLSTNKPTRDRDGQSLRKSPTPAQPVPHILRALEPPSVEPIPHSGRSQSEDGYSTIEHYYPRDQSERREKKPAFWAWDRTKDNDKERDGIRDRGRDSHHRRDDENVQELTKMIGYLCATASEDWTLVMEVCDRASANENNAREAVRTLRREFKYGEPASQLSAARIWAIMLRNCSNTFISQSTSRKFLETVEELLTSNRTSPVVRERLLEVIAAAAFASVTKGGGRGDRDGFRGLWRRVKPFDKPDEGMPFENDDAMLNPPVTSRNSQFEPPVIYYQEPESQVNDVIPVSPPPARPHKKRKSPTRNRIIPPDEDIRRLFQECKIGQGNAGLLSQALIYAKPETFKKDPVIREFFMKCRSSQELIYAQIDWATAEAEKSITTKYSEYKDSNDDKQSEKATKEEQLLSAILVANAELLEVLKQYEDMERVAEERKAEHRSRKETRMDRREIQTTLDPTNRNSAHYPSISASRSPSPSNRSISPHRTDPRRTHPSDSYHNLAPPPPHGPRLPGHHVSRTPSPNANNLDSQNSNAISLDTHDDLSSIIDDSSDVNAPIQPSAKALGKQRADPSDDITDTQSQFANDNYYDPVHGQDTAYPAFHDDSDREDQAEPPWHRPVNYVYDAAAERAAQRVQEGYEQQAVLINGIH